MGASSRSLSLAFSVFLVSMVLVSATGNEYSSQKSSSEEILTKVIGIQGIIYCKTASQLVPIKDAIARITCLAVDKKGYETAPFSILSKPADAKGYYFAKLSPAELEKGWRLTQCKVFLEKSPLKSCNVPTDVNHGKTGATLSSPRLLKTMNLYSIPAFVYTSDAPAVAAIPPVPRGY
ncbi:protein SEED AND ROOT HAIR PROTECTIVE PROTEIN [Daucus carota subsp. sativus]|uniref:protein SEED AND ROOT HAIR PROTECTIVE PROTEIN n=1 Tax=Daucus carota subsp. sativus TaxID=79200 RepID=UPI0007B1E5BC|nr:PREDICTED: proline-rich protein 1-like [Daucus carota subsp. sativus]